MNNQQIQNSFYANMANFAELQKNLENAKTNAKVTENTFKTYKREVIEKKAAWKLAVKTEDPSADDKKIVFKIAKLHLKRIKQAAQKANETVRLAEKELWESKTKYAEELCGNVQERYSENMVLVNSLQKQLVESKEKTTKALDSYHALLKDFDDNRRVLKESEIEIHDLKEAYKFVKENDQSDKLKAEISYLKTTIDEAKAEKELMIFSSKKEYEHIYNELEKSKVEIACLKITIDEVNAANRNLKCQIVRKNKYPKI